MSQPFTQLYVHYVWATRDRLPLIDPSWEADLHAAIAAKCREFGCDVLAVNGSIDHVHLLVRLPATITVAGLVKEAKGASSHLANRVLSRSAAFRWQVGYGAFTVGKSGVEAVARYVRTQGQRHASGRVIGDLERWDG